MIITKYMNKTFYFPFGEKLEKLCQTDKSSKKVFVLGVYASAVHAKWIDKSGKQLVTALAVASEPEIFWRGENAEEIISNITIPQDLGKLVVPTNKNLNGPSGIALDKLFLEPLGFERKDAWLCDLLPESRVNTHQRAAINKYYNDDIVQKFHLNKATVPNFDKKELDCPIRRNEILLEIFESKAETIILLGDLPIYWFLRYYNNNFKRLTDFGETFTDYGNIHNIKIANKLFKVIPLCHPRQADKLGNSNNKWWELHQNWIKSSH